MFAPLGFVRRLSGDQIAPSADPSRARRAGPPTLRDAVEAGAWLCGPPDRIAEKLMQIQHKYPGLEQVNVGQVVGTPRRVIVDQLEWFAKDVMPAFKDQALGSSRADTRRDLASVGSGRGG